jgi:dTDP-glucose 4,6-dehydratase
MKKILILGSNSFSGNHLSAYLLKKNFIVIGCSYSKLSPKRFNPIFEIEKKKQKKFSFYKININKEFSKLKKIILKHKPQIIIDFLGQGMVAESWTEPAITFETNLISKIKLYDFLKEKKFLKKYIKISTPEIFGSALIKNSKYNLYNPSTPYALSHSSIEIYLKLLNKQFAFPFIISRFANFYGPYQKLYRLIPLAIHMAKKKKVFQMHGGGKSRRSFIYSYDFCIAIYKMIMHGKTGNTYNFSSKEYLSIREVVRRIYLRFNLNPQKYIKNVKDRLGKDKDYKIFDQDTRRSLKWTNKYNFEDGLNCIIQWYNKNEKNFKITDKKFIIQK